MLLTKVSVSLRSYIHSYLNKSSWKVYFLKSFRLLTELYSFLRFSSSVSTRSTLLLTVSVSLRSYIHSYRIWKKFYS